MEKKYFVILLLFLFKIKDETMTAYIAIQRCMCVDLQNFID